MALNSASHNTPGVKTGPISGQPPPVSEEVQDQILQASETNGIGQSTPGRDGGDKDAGKKVKSEKELAKERAKQEKLRKFQEKQAKQASKADNKPKDKPKPKPAAAPQPDLSDYVEETPKGQKKILKPLDDEWHKAYVPKVVESAWADWWDSAGFFKPEFANDGGVKPAGRFVIPIPPPSTATLTSILPK
jgi:valyl-tRNA synthetase